MANENIIKMNMLPYTTTNYKKTIKNPSPKKSESLTGIIRRVLGEPFQKGGIIKVTGYETIDRSWTVEGDDTRIFREHEIGVCKGDIVWQQVNKLMGEKDRIYKMEKTWIGQLPVVTIWRVY